MIASRHTVEVRWKQSPIHEPQDMIYLIKYIPFDFSILLVVMPEILSEIEDVKENDRTWAAAPKAVRRGADRAGRTRAAAAPPGNTSRLQLWDARNIENRVQLNKG
jgi:hypothetical protein